MLYLSISVPALAQSDRGTITGTVNDPAGGVVPGATIVATNKANGSTTETVTTTTGNYTLPALPSGVYDLTVQATGFDRYVQQGIDVQVAKTARIDVSLKIGAATESVTVVADALMWQRKAPSRIRHWPATGSTNSR